MIYAVAFATDIVGITILAYLMYFRRHFRRDLLLSFVALNAGILTVMTVLSNVSVGVGLGLGLFSILSIIRLRSDQITQGEIAYYFISLTMGLVAGLHPAELWIVPTLTAGLLAVMYVADHPRLLANTRRQVLTLEHAYIDEASLIDALCILVRGDVREIVVMETDLVRDTTVVDVRYVIPKRSQTVEKPVDKNVTPMVKQRITIGRRAAR